MGFGIGALTLSQSLQTTGISIEILILMINCFGLSLSVQEVFWF